MQTGSLGDTLSLTIGKEINCVKCLLLKSSLKIGMSDFQERVGPSCQFSVIVGKEHFRSAALNTEGKADTAVQIGCQD